MYRVEMVVNYIFESLRPVILWDFDLHFVIRVGAHGEFFGLKTEEIFKGFKGFKG